VRLVLMGCCWMPRMSGGVPSPRGIGRAVGHHASCLDVVFLDVLWTVTPFRMNCLSLVRWAPFIQVTAGQPALSLVVQQS